MTWEPDGHHPSLMLLLNPRKWVHKIYINTIAQKELLKPVIMTFRANGGFKFHHRKVISIHKLSIPSQNLFQVTEFFRMIHSVFFKLLSYVTDHSEGKLISVLFINNILCSTLQVKTILTANSWRKDIPSSSSPPPPSSPKVPASSKRTSGMPVHPLSQLIVTIHCWLPG